ASLGAGSKSGSLAVVPPVPTSVAFSPSSVMGGTASTGTVTLNGKAPSGATIGLSSDNTAAATVPASIPITAGATTAQFTVTTYPVATTATPNITASFGGGTKSGALTVGPPGLISVTFNPASVTGGT